MWNVLSFSGGKDSTALLFMMLEKGMPVDQIIFADLGMEFPQIYEHIELVKERIKPLTIDVVKVDFEYYLYKKPITRGPRKGQLGYGWPTFRTRWCTGRKTEAIQNAVKNHPFKMFCGIAANEHTRGPNVEKPLVDWLLTEGDTLRYCYKLGFTFGGLYDIFERTGCFCCPLKGIADYKKLMKHFPDLWKRIKQLHKQQHKETFTLRHTIEELERR